MRAIRRGRRGGRGRSAPAARRQMVRGGRPSGSHYGPPDSTRQVPQPAVRVLAGHSSSSCRRGGHVRRPRGPSTGLAAPPLAPVLHPVPDHPVPTGAPLAVHLVPTWGPLRASLADDRAGIHRQHAGRRPVDLVLVAAHPRHPLERLESALLVAPVGPDQLRPRPAHAVATPAPRPAVMRAPRGRGPAAIRPVAPQRWRRTRPRARCRPTRALPAPLPARSCRSRGTGRAPCLPRA